MRPRTAYGIIAVLLIFLIPAVTYADLGPKPSADIHVTLKGEEIEGDFSARMFTCHYKMEYEDIIKELDKYETSVDWFDRCEEIAPQYRYNSSLCHSELQNQRGMTNVSRDAHCDNDICKDLIKKIPDTRRGCYWTPAPLAWGGECSDSVCRFHYFLPDSFKLAVYLPHEDRVYISGEINRTNFNSAYEAGLKDDGTIELAETTPFIQKDSTAGLRGFSIALVLTLVLECIVALIFILLAKLPRKIISTVVAANLLSLPIVWFVFPLVPLVGLVIPLAEAFAFFFEAYFIYWFNKKSISLKKSYILSLLMNLASFMIGGFIFIGIFLIFGI